MTRNAFTVVKSNTESFVVIPKFILDAYNGSGTVKIQRDFEKYQIMRLQKEVQLLKKLREEQATTTTLRRENLELKNELQQLKDQVKKKEEEREKLKKELIQQQQKQQEELQKTTQLQIQQPSNALSQSATIKLDDTARSPQALGGLQSSNQPQMQANNIFNTQEKKSVDAPAFSINNNPFNLQNKAQEASVQPQATDAQQAAGQSFSFANTQVHFGDRPQTQLSGVQFNVVQNGFGQSNASHFGFSGQPKSISEFNTLNKSSADNIFRDLL